MSANVRLLLLLCCGPLRTACWSPFRPSADQIQGFWLKYGGGKAIHGFKPPGEGRHPLYIWLTGTMMWFNTAADHDLTYAMASRGYVAAQVKYPNMVYHDTCAFMDQQTAPIFQGQGSALDLLCSLPSVDCSLGVAVHGFSQGAHIAALSSNYDSRISAVLLFGNGNFANGATSGRHRRLMLNTIRSSHRCLRYAGPPHHRIGKNKVRSIVGSHDRYMGKTLPNVIKQQELTTGYSCGDATSCLQPDGSGYYVITHEKRRREKHEFFVKILYFARSKFKDGNEPWCMNPNLDWLAKAAFRGGPGAKGFTANATVRDSAANVAAAFELEQLPAAPRRGLVPAAAAAAAAAAALVLAGLALALRARRGGAGPSAVAGAELLAVEEATLE